MCKALSAEGFGTVTRGDGEKGRPSSDSYQVQYLCAYHGKMVVAGRQGIVTEVRRYLVMDNPQLGFSMLICQLDFAVGIGDSTHIRVAAIVADSTVVERPEGAALWRPFVDELLAKSVRVLVFKDSDEHFRKTLNGKMRNTQISKVCGPGPAFFVLGPVQHVIGDRNNVFTYDSSEAGDSSIRWPVVGEVKLKPPWSSQVANTTLTFVIVGGSPCRRSQGAFERRQAKAKIRRKGAKNKQNARHRGVQ